MKTIIILFLYVLLFISYSSHAQSKTDGEGNTGVNIDENPDGTSILDKSKTLQTDILILNTCTPNQLSIVRMYDDYRQEMDLPARKLSINANRFSTFKIININPNRYIYSINNTLVTQFMDNDPFNASNNSFTNGNTLQKNEIEIIELFKANKNLESKRNIIDNKKDEIRSLSVDIRNINILIDQKYSELESAEINKQTAIKKEIFELQNNKLNDLASKYDEALSDYRKIVSNLTIEDNQLLENFINLKDRDYSSKDLEEVIDRISQQAIDLNIKMNSLDLIKDQVVMLSSNTISSLLENNSETISSKNRKTTDFTQINKSNLNFEDAFSTYNYTINNDNLKSTNPSVTLLEITKMEEFIYDEKIKNWEFFVLYTSKEIGKLLQNKIIDLSEKQNAIVQKTYIDKKDIESIKKWSEDLRVNFTVIRNISSDLNVLIKYLELKDEVFGSIVNGVNNNYNRLKEFLSFLNFTCENNTVEYTLPTHTNLKNVDLLRYQINRVDKITQSSQSYVYDIWIKGGFKIDFSAGIFATSLIDYNYEKIQAYSKLDPSILLTDSVSINRKDNGNFDFAFGGMVNLSYRTGACWIAPGISLGTAFANNQKLQFLGALSLQLGKTERLILHGGFAAGLSKTLDLASLNYNHTQDNDGGKSYLVKGTYENFNIPTIDKFQFKPFFGISYNLSKKNALQAVSNANDNSSKSKDGVVKSDVNPK